MTQNKSSFGKSTERKMADQTIADTLMKSKRRQRAGALVGLALGAGGYGATVLPHVPDLVSNASLALSVGAGIGSLNERQKARRSCDALVQTYAYNLATKTLVEKNPFIKETVSIVGDDIISKKTYDITADKLREGIVSDAFTTVWTPFAGWTAATVSFATVVGEVVDGQESTILAVAGATVAGAVLAGFMDTARVSKLERSYQLQFNNLEGPSGIGV